MAIDLKINDTVKTVTKAYVNNKQITSIYLGNQLIFPFRVTWRFLIGINTYTEVVELYQYGVVPSRSLPQTIQTEDRAKTPTGWDDLSPIISDRVITCIYVDGLYATFEGHNCTASLSDGFYPVGTEVTWTADEGYYFDRSPVVRQFTTRISQGVNAATAVAAIKQYLTIDVISSNLGTVTVRRDSSPLAGGSIGVLVTTGLTSYIAPFRIEVYYGDTITTVTTPKNMETTWSCTPLNGPSLRGTYGTASSGNLEIENSQNYFSVNAYYKPSNGINWSLFDDNPIPSGGYRRQNNLNFNASYDVKFVVTQVGTEHTYTKDPGNDRTYLIEEDKYLSFDFYDDTREIGSREATSDILSVTTAPQATYTCSFEQKNAYASWDDTTSVVVKWGTTATTETINLTQTRLILHHPDNTLTERIVTGSPNAPSGKYYKPLIDGVSITGISENTAFKCYGELDTLPGWVEATFSGVHCSADLTDGTYPATQLVTWTADTGYFFSDTTPLDIVKTIQIQDGLNQVAATNTKPVHTVRLDGLNESTRKIAWGTVQIYKTPYVPGVGPGQEEATPIFESTPSNPRYSYVGVLDEGDKLRVVYTPKSPEIVYGSWIPSLSTTLQAPTFVSSTGLATYANFTVKNPNNLTDDNNNAVGIGLYYNTTNSTSNGTKIQDQVYYNDEVTKNSGLSFNTDYYAYFLVTPQRTVTSTGYKQGSDTLRTYQGTTYLTTDVDDNLFFNQDSPETYTENSSTNLISSTTLCHTATQTQYQLTFDVNSQNNRVEWANATSLNVPYNSTYQIQYTDATNGKVIIKNPSGYTISTKTVSAINLSTNLYNYNLDSITAVPAGNVYNQITQDTSFVAASKQTTKKTNLFAVKLNITVSYNHITEVITVSCTAARVLSGDEYIPRFLPGIRLMTGFTNKMSELSPWDTSYFYSPGHFLQPSDTEALSYTVQIGNKDLTEIKRDYPYIGYRFDICDFYGTTTAPSFYPFYNMPAGSVSYDGGYINSNHQSASSTSPTTHNCYSDSATSSWTHTYSVTLYSGYSRESTIPF